MISSTKLIISCEHAVNSIPPLYRHYFEDHQSMLQTHQAIDFGALAIATYLQSHLDCELVEAEVSRLLIDCNRSLTHPQCFSAISKCFTAQEKRQLINDYYLPFRNRLDVLIRKTIAQGYQVWHLSVHSFTPCLDGVVRQTDLGFLYNPKRILEKQWAQSWRSLIKQHNNSLKIRMNYPYLGISDGHTTALRKLFLMENYLGMELEINQNLLQTETDRRQCFENIYGGFNAFHK